MFGGLLNLEWFTLFDRYEKHVLSVFQIVDNIFVRLHNRLNNVLSKLVN